jgi:hypothetical protein
MPPMALYGYAKACCVAALLMRLPVSGRAAEIDTEHLFGFMIGSDVGKVGEREFQSQTTGRFSKSGGRYRALNQEFELEFVPAPDFRVELGTTFAAHNIAGVAGLDDRRQVGWQGLSLDLRYRLLDRDQAPFGMTFAVEASASRIDETSGLPARAYGTEITLAFDRELIPGYVVAALNLLYQPEWTRLVGTDFIDRESTVGVAAAVMAQVRPGVFLGGEARYLRRYEGIGLQEFSGDALFLGPTAYLQLSERSRLTAAWSIQAWGHRPGDSGPLNLAGFERHQARLIYGVNF